jgi:hypothetical protein
MANEYIFEELQLVIKNRLEGIAHFIDIPVVAEDVGADPETLISDRVEIKVGEIGIVAVIMPILPLLHESEDTPGLYFSMRIPVRIVENPVLNRSDTGTKKTALQTIQQAMLALHHYCDPEYPDFSPLVIDTGIPFLSDEDLQRIIYDINIKTNGGIQTV